MRRTLLALLGLLLSFAARPAAARETRPSFGYGQIAPGGEAGKQVTRPLLAILLSFSDRSFAANHTRAFYRKLLFGPGFPNVAGFFAENSGGKFQVTQAGVVGPYRMPDDRDTPVDESRADCRPDRSDACAKSSRTAERDRATALRLAARNGFNFKAYDRNRDGKVTGDELMVIVVFASERNCGANRGLDPFPLSVGRGDRRVEVHVSAIGAFDENADFATVTHEISHTLGTHDLYGPWNDRWIGYNYGSTLMGATCGGTDRRWSVNLDPWHRIQLGWAKPRVVAASEAGSCFRLLPSHAGGASPDPRRNPLLIWDPARGEREYFLVEYRKRSREEQAEGNGVAPSSRYDADVAATGVAVWLVQEKDDGSLDRVRVAIERRNAEGSRLRSRPQAGTDDVAVDPDGDGRPDYIAWGMDNVLQSRVAPARRRDEVAESNTVWVAAPRQAGSAWETGPLGTSTYFGRAQGLFRLIWRGGADSGVRLHVGPDGSDPMPVRVLTRKGGGGPPLCLAQTNAAPGHYPPVLVRPERHCIERPTAVDPTRRGGRRIIGPGPSFGVRVELGVLAREGTRVTLRVTSGNGTVSPGSVEVPVGGLSAAFQVTGDRGFEWGRIDLEAVVERGDDQGRRTDRGRATVRVTPDQPLVAGEKRFTCSQTAALEAEAAEIGRLAQLGRDPPMPAPPPYLKMDPAALARSGIRLPSAVLPFLNRARIAAPLRRSVLVQNVAKAILRSRVLQGLLQDAVRSAPAVRGR